MNQKAKNYMTFVVFVQTVNTRG